MSKVLSGKRLIQIFLTLSFVGLAFPSFSTTREISVISDLKGDVKLKKQGWARPRKAQLGNTLSPPDELEVATGAVAKVFCGNGKPWSVKPGKHRVSDGCRPGTVFLKVPESNSDTRRPLGLTEEALSEIPYIITPRNTSILSDRPTLRWNAVPGATRYTVKVDGVNWETQASATQVTYPGEPPLKSGWRYRVTVETDSGTSSRSEGVVGFVVLDEQNTKSVLAAVATVKQQGLTQEAEGLILAHLYRSYDLQADAVEVLEGLVKRGSQVAAVYQLLGDTYLQIGLSQLAKMRYLKALELATSAGNLEGQAAGQAGLGEAYYGLGNEGDTVQWLEKAQAGYTELGDKAQVMALEQRINSILGRE